MEADGPGRGRFRHYSGLVEHVIPRLAAIGRVRSGNSSQYVEDKMRVEKMRGRGVTMFGKFGQVAMAVAAISLSFACEEEKPAAEEKPKAAATATQTAQLAAAKKEEPKEEKKPERPTKIDTELTDERRSAIETAYPDAKGFIDIKELEEKLKKDTKVAAKEAANAAIDKAAKGKWVVVSGPMINLSDDAFELAVSYTPRDPKDMMGMSQQFVTINFRGVEGYSKDEFKAGQVVVVLAKYDGSGKSTKGYELVEAGHWK